VIAVMAAESGGSSKQLRMMFLRLWYKNLD
jgi:hypothetical protein